MTPRITRGSTSTAAPRDEAPIPMPMAMVDRMCIFALERSGRALFRKRRIAELEAFLRAIRYRVFKIENGDRLIAREALDPGGSTDLMERDYLCVPDESSGGVATELRARPSA